MAVAFSATTSGEVRPDRVGRLGHRDDVGGTEPSSSRRSASRRPPTRRSAPAVLVGRARGWPRPSLTSRRRSPVPSELRRTAAVTRCPPASSTVSSSTVATLSVALVDPRCERSDRPDYRGRVTTVSAEPEVPPTQAVHRPVRCRSPSPAPLPSAPRPWRRCVSA